MAEKEYIERDEAVRKAIDACIKVVGHGITQFDAADIADEIDAIPAADVVEVRHGVWKTTKKVLASGHPYIDDDYYIRVECSECGFVVQETKHSLGYAKPITTNYCPNCGAKMDRKSGENL